MTTTQEPSVRARLVLLSLLIGAVIAAASVIAYSNYEREMPPSASFVVSTISWAVMPGYILSALILNNIHDANLVLAGVINLILYSSLALWLLSWRRKRRMARLTRS